MSYIYSKLNKLNLFNSYKNMLIVSRSEVIDLLLLRFVHLLVAFLACPGILVHVLLAGLHDRLEEDEWAP